VTRSDEDADVSNCEQRWQC